VTLEQLENENQNKTTVQQASSIMGVTPRFLQMGLQHEKFPFGAAIKFDKRWSYYINTERFVQYMKGRDLKNA
jgi:hypothetical protein